MTHFYREVSIENIAEVNAPMRARGSPFARTLYFLISNFLEQHPSAESNRSHCWILVVLSAKECAYYLAYIGQNRLCRPHLCRVPALSRTTRTSRMYTLKCCIAIASEDGIKRDERHSLETWTATGRFLRGVAAIYRE